MSIITSTLLHTLKDIEYHVICPFYFAGLPATLRFSASLSIHSEKCSENSQQCITYLCPQYIHCKTPAEHNITPCKCVGKSRFALSCDKIPNHLHGNHTFVHVLTLASFSLRLSPNDIENVIKVLGQMAVLTLFLNDRLNFDQHHAFKCKVRLLIFAKDDFGMVSLMQARFNLCLGNFHGCFPRCKLANVLG